MPHHGFHAAHVSRHTVVCLRSPYAARHAVVPAQPIRATPGLPHRGVSCSPLHGTPHCGVSTRPTTPPAWNSEWKIASSARKKTPPVEKKVRHFWKNSNPRGRKSCRKYPSLCVQRTQQIVSYNEQGLFICTCCRLNRGFCWTMGLRDATSKPARNFSWSVGFIGSLIGLQV